MNEEKKYLVRYLGIYKNVKLGDFISYVKLTIDEESVSGITVHDLKNMFRLKKHDPEMYAPYEIKKKHVKFFREKLNIEFDFEKYSYYIQSYLGDKNADLK